MLKGRGRDPRVSSPGTPQFARLAPGTPQFPRQASPGTPQFRQTPSTPQMTRQAAPAPRAPLAKPEPDYEVVEFPTEEYVNAKLQPPPTPPRPPTGHPVDAGASCGLCGGGGARVRCAECGRRALCASCDDMYHRHPKRRNHQRQALSPTQLREEQRPPLPPKSNAPVPPPRRHKISGDRSSASPRPPVQEQRRATLGSINTMPSHNQIPARPLSNHGSPQAIPPHLSKMLPPAPPTQLGSMPYLPTNQHQAAAPVAPQPMPYPNNTMGHAPQTWGRPRATMPSYNMPPNMQVQQPVMPETWEGAETMVPQAQTWGRPLRRGASVLELGGGPPPCPGCAHCAGTPWRYGSCASLDHGPWGWQPPCCPPQHHLHPHPHMHSSMTPQPYRRAESRAMSRAASRAGSRAASPAMSVRSRTSRRTKHRTPSPPPLPSSDADSESEESDHRHPPKSTLSPVRKTTNPPEERRDEPEDDSLGPAPPPPDASWQCEHCTFVNEPGVRVCVVCCRTPTTAPKVVPATNGAADAMARLDISEKNSARSDHARQKQNGEVSKVQPKKEKSSTGCGPSPPREDHTRKSMSRLVTPVRDVNENGTSRRHDMAVGPSPPKEIRYNGGKAPQPPVRHSVSVGPSPPREERQASVARTPPEPPTRHTISVGPSPPRERDLRPSTPMNQKKSVGASPPRGSVESRFSRSNVSNTGTSPPPQSISTQTYEVPTTWEREREKERERERERERELERERERDLERERERERERDLERERERAPSAPRSRSRRRFRDDARRERSHSRHSLSSDTRESERSVRTSGGRWEWREDGRSPRDSSPGAADWSSGERRRSARLTRRASHLDLRRARPVRRSSFYGEEVRDVSSPGAADWSSGERRRSARLTRRASHLDLRRARPVRRSSFYGEEVRDVSSPGAADWSSGERRRSARLTRRASHLDLRRARPVRRSSFYGEEVRDVSSPGAADWSSGERRRSARLTRRASHLDLRRARPVRRSSFYGEEVRDVSSPGAADWSSGERRRSARLTRRASHLDLRRARPVRRSSFYGEEVRDVSSPGAADWSSGERRRSARLTRRASHLDLRRARPVRRSSFYGEEVRDVSSPGAADWSSGERRRSARLTRRASHLDLRRARPVRRSSFYGEEVRDVSSPGAADWSSGERRRSARLTRRASHLDLRRARPVRRSSFYGEEVRDVSSPGAADWSSGERRRSARLTRRASHLDLRRARPVRRSSFYGEEVRDVSSPGAADWSSGERRRSARLTRRASHLDLRRARPVRRSSFYGEEAASPEPLPHNRAVSMEALAGAGGGGGAAREAERGLELARLMDAAERGGFSAAEVQAALAQSPAAPLAWLRSRWPSLVAGVQAAAARLAPGAVVTELEARAALARHRAAMWPAVTECVERHRRQEEGSVGEERRVRGRVWGSPVGLDDDAAPPPLAIKTTRRHHADDSSDEFEEPIPKTFQDDDWMYLPLPTQNPSPYDIDLNADIWGFPVNHKIEDLGQSFEPISTGIQLNIEEKPKITQDNPAPVQDKVEVVDTEEIAQKLKALLIQAGIPSINENLLLKGLLADNNNLEQNNTTDETIQNKTEKPDITIASNSEQTLDLGQSENDFINAYNALTRNSPLPNVNSDNTENVQLNNTELHNSGDRNVNLTSSIGATNNTVLQLNQNSDTSSASKYENIIETPLPTNDQALYNKTNAGGLIAVERPVEPINIIEEDNIPTISKEKTEVINIDLGTAHSNNEANINTDRNSPKQSGKQINKSPTENKPSAATKSSINIAESDTVVKDNDKSNNLNDIVDNTQKLIQQMKAEINSDINSLDDSNASHSEADNSSNESDLSTDHESLYTESEEDTDDLTTEDKDYTSSEDEEEQNTEKNTPGLARTSSEENEQFEEAMDHIEAQTGAIQKTNFEMLDSIARSLQEDHTVSLQLESKSKINRPKRQDVNNNFATVNSFEEIYEELNIDEPVKPEAPRVKNEVESIVVPKIEKLPYIKQEMDMLVFIPEPASVMMITEILLPVRNAIIEEPLPYIDESLESQDDLVDSETTVELNIKEPADEDNNDNAIQFNHILEDIVNDAPISDRLNSNKEGSPVATINTNVNNIEIATAVSALIEQNTDTSAISNQNENHIQNPKLPVSEIINTDSNKETQINNNGDNNSSRIESSNANQPIIQAQAESRSSKSPDKKSSSPSKDGRSSSSEKTTTKSNIPKLVKVLPSIKQKVEKIAPKVLASKVPVRRASIKQHPAPEPPKAHFGNIRSGHVKQLQTRLFDSKPGKPPAPATTIEIKPSTSTLNKKKPAPQPPTKQNSKQPSPPKTPSAQEKKEQYFRETCRTEDEWTESDSEDSQVQIVIKPEPEPVRSAPSPPPPLTLRRVSGQLIDLAHVRLPEGSPERQARMLLAEGAAESWEQAQLAVELVSRGAEPPAALLAALECADLCAALAYLHQDCELCAERLPEHEMVSMLRCTHRCCRECARLYFTVQVTERSIVDCVCPYCKEPELEALEEDAWLEYFAHLDILLKVLLDTDVHELFQRKLRDRTLARDPNFRWCVECSSGFFVHPKQKKVRCPECRSISCATCRKPWSASHEGLTCEQFAAWLEDNDPERSAAAVQQHLRENGLECPRCHFKYSLSRGGCMHFTCTQCKYEFCYGCGKPFTMGARCGLSEYCARLGLHAHHPRNCLFYLRDKEPHELQTLLQMNNVSFEIESPSPSGAAAARCPVQLQRETPTGLVDCACNADAPPKHAGLCKVHYVEYLAALCRPLDPIPIMDVPELVAELRRRALPLPERGPWDTDPIYAGMCAEIVKEKIPLD